MEQLKILRLSHKLTQQEVANILGVDRTTYVKYETGKSEPTFETLVRLADYFGVSTDYLLGRTDNPNTEEPAVKKDGGQKEIYDIIESLSPDNRAKLLELARLFLDAQHKSEEKK